MGKSIGDELRVLAECIDLFGQHQFSADLHRVAELLDACAIYTRVDVEERLFGLKEEEKDDEEDDE